MPESELPQDNTSTTPTTKMVPLKVVHDRRLLGCRYRVGRLIGRGGMANVYVADDLLLERVVAIKILHRDIASDAKGLERFRREAMALATVTSPHVVGIHDIGLQRDGAYLVMQHIDGQTLEQDVTVAGAMAPARARNVLGQILDGLVLMHAQGVLHRDIKPSNVVLDASDHVVLLDLGIALDKRRAPLTSPGMVAGTFGYLAPESRALGTSALTSDVYQVGLLVLFLLTGVDPGRRDEGTGVEDLLARVPAPFAHVARRALATDPAARFPSAAHMKRALSTELAATVPRQTRTAEIGALELLALVTQTSHSTETAGPRSELDARTTEIEAAQILSVRPSRQQISASAVAPARARMRVVRMPTVRQPPLVPEIVEVRPAPPAEPRSMKRRWLVGAIAFALVLVLFVFGSTGRSAPRAATSASSGVRVHTACDP
jgi:serine/threonine protein kinase